MTALLNTKSSSAQTIVTATRVALFDLDDAESTLLADCFKQFNLKTIDINDGDTARLTREKFEGCVLRLDDNSGSILEAVRNSPSNRRMLLYGITSDSQIAMRYSRFCINAIFRSPLQRADALKVVRSTYLLAMHEYRRYVRIPLAVQVLLTSDGRTFSGLSEELSSGGMSLRIPEMLSGKTSVKAKFILPDSESVTFDAAICWRREENLMGLRFDTEDKNRQLLRSWIDAFLQF